MRPKKSFIFSFFWNLLDSVADQIFGLGGLS